MRLNALLRSSSRLLPLFGMFVAGPAFAQGAAATSPGSSPAPPPPVLTLTQSALPPAPSKPDLFNSLISSAASVDMESPVAVRAEFDPPRVAVGGRAIYRLTLNALIESVKLPDAPPAPRGLVLVPGASGMNYQPVGGQKIQPQTTINYRAIATATGAFIIPSFNLLAYGKPVPVPEARIEVVPAGTPDVPSAPTLLVQLPPGDVYVGQTLKVAVALLDPGDGTLQNLSAARLTGDSIFSEPVSFGVRRVPLSLNGATFPALVQDVVITLLREGPQTLLAQANANYVPVPGTQGVVFPMTSLLVDSDPVELTVRSLPESGRLPGFNGAVGVFRLDPPKISAPQVRAGDPLTLSVTVRGDAGLGRLTMPSLPLLREWQTFPPVGDPLPPYVIQQRGACNFTFTLIPLSDRVKGTPPIPFSYFDPAKKTYVDLTIPPVAVTVEPSPKGSPALSGAGVPPPNPGSDETVSGDKELVLGGLAETPGRAASGLEPLQRRGWFLTLQLAPAAVLGGMWAWARRRRFLEEHPEVVRRRLARRGLRHQLLASRRAAAANDATGFVTGAVNALREACAPHDAANPGALVCADVLAEVAASGLQDGAGDVVRRLFGAGDALRFGGLLKDGPELLALQPQFERLVNGLRMRL